MDALQSYQTGETPSNTTTVDLALPGNGEPSDPEPVVDALLGDAAV